MIWVLGSIGVCIVIAVAIWYIRRELDIRDTMRRAYDADLSLERGIAVFKPEGTEQTRNFEILTGRKVMVRNPLGGYSLAGSYTELKSRAVRERIEPIGEGDGDD